MIGQGMLARKNIYRTGLIRKEKKKPIDKTQYTTRVFDLKEKTKKMKPTLGFIKQSIKRGENQCISVFLRRLVLNRLLDGITHEIVGVVYV